MLENTLKAAQLDETSANFATADHHLTKRRWLMGFILCAAGLVACCLLTVTPLIRIPDPVLSLHLTPGTGLAAISTWLPRTLAGLNTSTSAYSELFGLLSLAFLCYGLAALLVRRAPATDDQRVVRGVIWLSTLLIGIIYVATPAMLSHDILVYASYSRVLATYHANPYFVPIANFPQDPFAIHNYWSKVVSAYGPVWMLVCGFSGWLLHPDQSSYTLAFRSFALLFDLINIWLVGRILQMMGRSARTATLGMLLYAWNPLLLLESGLGGHNDGFMMTFVLAGILLAVRSEKRGQLLRARGYLPVVIMLTLAALVKFTALPILAAYLLFLACKALRPIADNPHLLRQIARNWRLIVPIAWSALAAALIALALYGPFWFGHSLTDIIGSFKNPPSSLYAENSFMRSIAEWQMHHPALHNSLLTLLGNRHFWDDLTIAGISLCLLFGVRQFWQKPTTRTFIVISLATMSIVLLITPWFFGWYITWLLGLSAVCLPVSLNRFEAALLALVSAFSFSALFTYLFNGNLFGSHYYLVSLFTTLPPTCAFLLTLVLWKPIHNAKAGVQKV
ncbi:MAG TPA: hypothetical protein VGM01_03075 [Ktedonobacteraceae bacterium]|jgi:hypothetical protein